MTPLGSSVGAPCTWERKPSSAYLSARVMPDFASWRLASTSWVLFPDGRDNAHPRDDNPPHDRLVLSLRFCVMAVVKPKAASSACPAQVSYVPSRNAASCLNRPTFKSFAR